MNVFDVFMCGFVAGCWFMAGVVWLKCFQLKRRLHREIQRHLLQELSRFNPQTEVSP